MYDTTKKCSYVGYITQAVSINLAPLLFIIFQKEFHISYAALGALTLINFVTQLFVDIISAFFLDRIGYRKSAVLSQVFSAAGLFLLPILAGMPFHYAGICVATVIYSVGAGLIEVVINPIMTSIPQDEKGSLIFLHSFYCWGQLMVVLITTLALKIFGSEAWRVITPAWGIIPLINAFAFMKAPLATDVPEKKEEMNYSQIRSGTFLLILILMICAGGAELAMAQWASIFAQNALGVDKLIGDIMGPCLFALFMGIGRSIHGIIGDRENFKLHIYINSALCVACYLLASFAKNPYVALSGCALCGYAVSIMWPGTVDIASKKFPEGSGTVYGLIAMAGDIGCSIAPYLTGVLADLSHDKSGGLRIAMPVNIIYPVIFAFIFFLISRMDKPELGKAQAIKGGNYDNTSGCYK